LLHGEVGEQLSLNANMGKGIADGEGTGEGDDRGVKLPTSTAFGSTQ
jgi:hypothetical protein